VGGGGNLEESQEFIGLFQSLTRTFRTLDPQVICTNPRRGGNKLYSASALRKHPKLYSYVNKYGWASMEIRVLALIPDHLSPFFFLKFSASAPGEDPNFPPAGPHKEEKSNKRKMFLL
jgi:hypothetical protein